MITVENCPLHVMIDLWLEGKNVEKKPRFVGVEPEAIEASRPGCAAFGSAGKTSKCSVSVFLKR
jgi:hypothetical protein